MTGRAISTPLIMEKETGSIRGKALLNFNVERRATSPRHDTQIPTRQEVALFSRRNVRRGKGGQHIEI